MKMPFAVLALTLSASNTAAQTRYTGPLVDVHVHAVGGEGRLQELEATRTARAFVSGGDSVVRNWIQRMPGRIIQSLALPCFTVVRAPCYPQGGELPDPRWVRNELQAGRFRAFGELLQQYAGLQPTDPQLEPYFALAEEFDVPVGIHLALAPPNTPATLPRFRTYLGKPQLLEEVLAKHPRLRVYVMHAGYPYGDEMLALLYMYPHVYVDISAIAMPRFLPRAGAHQSRARAMTTLMRVPGTDDGTVPDEQWRLRRRLELVHLDGRAAESRHVRQEVLPSTARSPRGWAA